MTVSGVVMAHPKRQEWAEQLSADLGLPVVWDQIQDRHDTGLRCLQAGIDSDATHWLILQDDAITCADLLAGLERAVQVSQDRLVGLYVGNVRPEAARSTAAVKTAQAAGVSWCAMPGPWWGVGVVIPTVHLPALCESFGASKKENYDGRIAAWATKAKVECWYTMPSLVDHRAGEENPSLVAGRGSLTRTARWFIGADRSALDVDWSRTPVPSSDWWRRIGTDKVQKCRVGSPQAERIARSGLWEQVVEGRCGECGSRRFTPLADRQEVCA